MESKSKSIDLFGLKKVGKGALIAAGAGFLTYVLEALPGVNLGAYTPMIMGVAGIAINFVRKWLMDSNCFCMLCFFITNY